MSRVVKIRGKVIIQNIELAKEAIKECKYNIEIVNNKFVFEKYDHYDGRYKKDEIIKIENIYLQKFNVYLEEIAEEERLKIEEEKRILREQKADIAIANAKKQGYKVKKEIKEDNTIKLILQKRVY